MYRSHHLCYRAPSLSSHVRVGVLFAPFGDVSRTAPWLHSDQFD